MFMGFSCADHFILDEKEGGFPLFDEIENQQQGQGMEVHHHHHHESNENNTDFFPVEHPMEPTDEDRPVKCPMPESSVINNDGGVHDKRYAESLRKRVEISETTVDGGGGRVATMDTEPPTRGVRKRHHTLTHGGDLVMTPLMTMPAPPPHPPLPSQQNITIFEMLQQLDKFQP